MQACCLGSGAGGRPSACRFEDRQPCLSSRPWRMLQLPSDSRLLYCTMAWHSTAVEKNYKTNRHSYSYSIAAANRLMAGGAPAARVRARVAHFALASDLTLALICTQLCQTHSVNTATSEASTETNAGHACSQCHDWDHRTNRETRLELAGRQVLHACLCNRGYSYEAGNDQG